MTSLTQLLLYFQSATEELPRLPQGIAELLWFIYPLILFFYVFIGNVLITILAARSSEIGPALDWQTRARNLFPIRSLIGFFGALMFVAVVMWSMIVVAYGFSALKVSGALFVLLCMTAVYFGSVCAQPFMQRMLFLERISLSFFARNSVCSYLLMTITFVGCYYLTRSLEAYGTFVIVAANVAFVLVLLQSPLRFRLLKIFGLIRPAAERLQQIAKVAAEEAGLKFEPRVLIIENPAPNAFAFPRKKIVTVTSAALVLLNDAELKSILHHEYGHLQETNLDFVMRLAPLGVWLAYCGSVSKIGDTLGLYGLLLSFPVVIFLLRWMGRAIARRLEERADSMTAKVMNTDTHTYAAALEKIYAANFIPAVMGSRRATHPDLYDRMLKAGVTPAYARPEPPPKRLRLWGRCAIVLCSILFLTALTVVHTTTVKAFPLRSHHLRNR